MQIRRALLFDTLGSKTEQKAVVLLMLLKKRLGKTSSIPHASINKIAKMANVSPSTINRYMPIWSAHKLVEWRGSEKNIFVVKKLHSSTRHRNVSISRLDFKTFKGLYQSFRSLLFIIVNSRKEFVKRLIRVATNPRKGENFKAAIKCCNHYAVASPGDHGLVYHEYGFSYKGIGKALGFCARTAEKIVNFAILRKWCTKERHFDVTKLPNVHYRYVEGYTFTTRNYGIKVGANTYSASRAFLAWQ